MRSLSEQLRRPEPDEASRSEMERIVIVLSLLGAAVALYTSPVVSGASSGTPRCRQSQLRLVAGAYGEAAQQFMQTLTFVNVSSRECQLMGWPTIRVKSELGRPLVVRTIRVIQGAPTARPFKRVRLGPGRAASFNVYGADWNAAANRPCRQTSAILVKPPGLRAAFEVRVRVPNCGVFYIAPLIAGRRDRKAWSIVWNP